VLKPAKSTKKGERRPIVICLHGYFGHKYVYTPAYVRELTEIQAREKYMLSEPYK